MILFTHVHKNFGPSGITLVIKKGARLNRAELPNILKYNAHAVEILCSILVILLDGSHGKCLTKETIMVADKMEERSINRTNLVYEAIDEAIYTNPVNLQRSR